MKARPATRATARATPAPITADERAQGSADPCGQRDERVAALRREPVARTHRSGKVRLRDALAVAALAEVAPRGAGRGDPVVDARSGNVDEDAVRDRAARRGCRRRSPRRRGRACSCGRAPSLKPPTATSTSLRNDMLAPMRLRTSVPSSMPRYVQPRTQSNSSGNQPGRELSQSGAMNPAHSEHVVGRVAGRPALRATLGLRSASSSRNAMISPVASSSPVLRAPESPAGCVLAVDGQIREGAAMPV